ncbi:MAG: hypothetical protein JXA14_23755 [Anaerolineae bacterium]|nr:hypothetical protein [Anaerolineae bacterium]
MPVKRVFQVVLVASAVVLAVGIGPRISGPTRALPLAETGVTIPYFGSLTDEAGQAVVDGAYDFAFALYEGEGGGEPEWMETQKGVMVQEGTFTALLGSVAPLSKEVLESGARWLEVAVRGPGEVEYTLLSPRQELSTATSAAPAGPMAPANGLSCWHTHWGETWNGAGVGLDLGSSNDTALWAHTSGGWAGVDGRNSTGMGVYGESVSGTGVVGKTTVTTGDTTGVYGEVASSGTYARAVVGWATKTSGTNYGMWGESESSAGYGVFGRSPYVGVKGIGEGAGKGVSGETSTGVGVYAYAAGNGVALRAEGQVGGNLIEAWHGPMFSGRKFYVTDAGEVYAAGNFHSGSADFAEMLPAVEGLEPGDVLVIGDDGQLARSSAAYQPTVVGVYSTNPGFVGGDGDDADPAGKVPLAVVGVVSVKVSAENGPIRPGDLLVASSAPGHAMKAGSNPSAGVVIGKALTSLESDTGVIQMLVMLQ